MNKLEQQISIDLNANLNKQNFWNKCLELYPITTRHFCEFIDKYKKLKFNIIEIEGITWNDYFNNTDEDNIEIKFHHIPYEMQIGIIFRFFDKMDLNVIGAKNSIFNKQNHINIICECFEILETTFENNKETIKNNN